VWGNSFVSVIKHHKVNRLIATACKLSELQYPALLAIFEKPGESNCILQLFSPREETEEKQENTHTLCLESS
jgi:hypothetical protein